MPERTQTGLEELPLTEFALLEFTNDGVVERPEYKPFGAEEPLVLTTKASYLWSATLSVMVADEPAIESDRITDAYRASLRRSAEEIHAHYTRYAAHMGYHPRHEEAHLYSIHDEFCGQLGFAHRQDVIRRAQASAERSYESLLRARLIEDPIFTTVFGWSLIALGDSIPADEGSGSRTRRLPSFSRSRSPPGPERGPPRAA